MTRSEGLRPEPRAAQLVARVIVISAIVPVKMIAQVAFKSPRHCLGTVKNRAIQATNMSAAM